MTSSANIIGIFLANAERHASTAAIIDGDRTVDYAELACDVRRVARHLELEGIRAGDHVLIFVPMSRELYTLILALFYIGAVAVFVDAWSDRRRLDLVASTVPLRAFIGIGKSHALRLVSRAIRAIPIKLVARIDRWRGDGVEPSVADVRDDDSALVTFTTGSTGAPKGAKRTHRFLVAQHRALVESFGTRHGDVDMPMLPIFVLNDLAAGATSVFPAIDPRNVASFDPARVLEQMRRHRVTTSVGSPASFIRLAEHVRTDVGDSPSGPRRIFVGGAPVGPRIASTLVAAFPATEITIVYGSTEAEPISTIDARAMIERAPAHEGLPVGRVVPSIDLVILPITDGDVVARSEHELRAMSLPAREPGEICVSGDHVLDEYFGDGSTWAKSKIDTGARRWHRTGDAGYLDTDGELYLMGRAGQSFVRGGRRTFVLPVEEKLAAIEGVAAGTILLASGLVVVVIEATGDVTRATIERAVREREIRCDVIAFVATIPRDPRHNSKIDYAKLREQVLDLTR